MVLNSKILFSNRRHFFSYLYAIIGPKCNYIIISDGDNNKKKTRKLGKITNRRWQFPVSPSKKSTYSEHYIAKDTNFFSTKAKGDEKEKNYKKTDTIRYSLGGFGHIFRPFYHFLTVTSQQIGEKKQKKTEILFDDNDDILSDLTKSRYTTLFFF